MIEDLSQVIANNVISFGESVSLWMRAHFLNIVLIIIFAFIAKRLLTIITVKLLSKTIRPDMYPTESDRKKRLATLDALMTAVIKVAVWIIAILMIITEIGINTAPLLASAGIVGIALGFGAQSLIKDFVSGIFIISENQYRVGDVIEIAGANGTVENVGIRTTVLRDMSGYVHHVPNGLIDVTTNKTIGYNRINEELVVSFGSDISKVEKIINKTGQDIARDPKFEKAIREPFAFSSVKGYAVNGLIIGILGKTKPGEQWGVRTEMYKRLQKEFNKANIEVTNIPPVGVGTKPAKKKA
ncbi:MAG: mechanosensitive ion channel family protein [Candidatus Saccharimonadales bacterium]